MRAKVHVALRRHAARLGSPARFVLYAWHIDGRDRRRKWQARIEMGAATQRVLRPEGRLWVEQMGRHRAGGAWRQHGGHPFGVTRDGHLVVVDRQPEHIGLDFAMEAEALWAAMHSYLLARQKA